MWCCGLSLAFAVATAGSSFADDKPTFADLLTKAQTQAAAGHRWSPPGDNMTETIAAMMDMIPTATPRQLADLSALLESDAARPHQSSERASVAPTGSTNLAPAELQTLAPAALPNRALAEAPNQVPTGQVPTGSSHVAPAEAPNLASAELPNRAQAESRNLAPVESPNPASVARPVATEATVSPGRSVTDRGTVDRGMIDKRATDKGPVALPAPARMQAGPRAADLFVRGQEAERVGDVSGARRYYAAAADQGSATAARSLGRLYDPGFLKQTAVGGIDPDPALARRWYERAVAMGDAQAAPLLQALAAR
jgi:hypothetical protein